MLEGLDSVLSVAAMPVAWSCARPPAASQSQAAARVQKDFRAGRRVSPPDSQQGQPLVGGQGLEEVDRESIPHARPPAAGRSRLPVGGPCSVEVVHASELPVRHPPSSHFATGWNRSSHASFFWFGNTRLGCQLI